MNRFGTQYQSTNPFLAQSGVYRYGFNGQENQNETTTSSYDFGARVLNPKLGKWLSVDPLILEYPSTSPYSYVNNQPIVAIDPDGKKILFVNGYWCPGWCGDAVGSKEPGKGYWGAGFTEAAQRFFSDYSLISGANYIDGSSTVGFDEDGEDRYEKGRDYAKNNLETITSGMVEGETIKIVSHSEGCAMAAGITSYLIESGYKVEIVVYLSSDESSDFKAPAEPTSLQLAYCDDAVTVEETISGVDKHGVVYDSDLEAKYHHGQTKSSGVFELLKDLKTVGVTEYLTMCPQDKNAHIIPAQTPETAPNGTVFSEINGRQLFDLETCEPIDQ